MLVLTRKTKQSVLIELAEDVSPQTPVGELFKDGPIVVRLLEAGAGQARIGIQAPGALRIRREELDPE